MEEEGRERLTSHVEVSEGSAEDTDDVSSEGEAETDEGVAERRVERNENDGSATVFLLRLSSQNQRN